MFSESLQVDGVVQHQIHTCVGLYQLYQEKTENEEEATDIKEFSPSQDNLGN